MVMSWYTSVKAPFGTMYAVAERDRIVQICPAKPLCVLAMERNTLSLLTRTAEELRAYFEGRAVSLSVPFPTDLPPFAHAVYSRVTQIPYGETLSVAQLCREIGYPHALHAVRMLCRSNPLWIAVPCHRVEFSPRSLDRAHPLSYEETLRQMEKRYKDTLTKPPKEGKL